MRTLISLRHGKNCSKNLNICPILYCLMLIEKYTIYNKGNLPYTGSIVDYILLLINFVISILLLFQILQTVLQVIHWIATYTMLQQFKRHILPTGSISTALCSLINNLLGLCATSPRNEQK